MKINNISTAIWFRIVAVTIAVSMPATELYAYLPDTALPPRFFTSTENEITVPAHLGSIREVFNAQGTVENPRPTLIYLQDAHGSLSAQESLAGLIKYLHKDYGTGLLLVEGAEGDQHLHEASSFPDEEIRRQVAREFLESWKISGPEYYMISADPDITMAGAERLDAYYDNREAFWRAHRTAQSLTERLTRFSTAIRNLENVTYNKTLRAFVREEEKATAHNGFFLPHLRFLSAQFGKYISSDPMHFLRRFPSLAPFLNAGSIRTGSRETRAGQVLAELDDLRSAVQNKLIRNERERAVLELGRCAKRLEKLLTLALDRSAYDRVVAEQDKLSKTYFRQALEALGAPQIWDSEFDVLLDSVADALTFYAGAVDRDRIFVTQMEDQLAERNAKKAILVAGGFHTGGVTAELREKNISYVVIQPAISNFAPDEAEHYIEASEVTAAATLKLAVGFGHDPVRRQAFFDRVNTVFLSQISVKAISSDRDSSIVAADGSGFGAGDASQEGSPKRPIALAIDANAHLRALARVSLERRGYRVFGADSLAEGKRKIMKYEGVEHVEMALSMAEKPWQMNRMLDGFKFARWVSAEYPKTKLTLRTPVLNDAASALERIWRRLLLQRAKQLNLRMEAEETLTGSDIGLSESILELIWSPDRWPTGHTSEASNRPHARYYVNFLKWRAHRLGFEDLRSYAQFLSETKKRAVETEKTTVRKLFQQSVAYGRTSEQGMSMIMGRNTLDEIKRHVTDLIKRRADAHNHTLQVRLVGLGIDIEELKQVGALWRSLGESLPGGAASWTVRFNVYDSSGLFLGHAERWLNRPENDDISALFRLHWMDITDEEQIRYLWRDRPADIVFMRNVFYDNIRNFPRARSALFDENVLSRDGLLITDGNTSDTLLSAPGEIPLTVLGLGADDYTISFGGIIKGREVPTVILGLGPLRAGLNISRGAEVDETGETPPDVAGSGFGRAAQEERIRTGLRYLATLRPAARAQRERELFDRGLTPEDLLSYGEVPTHVLIKRANLLRKAWRQSKESHGALLLTSHPDLLRVDWNEANLTAAAEADQFVSYVSEMIKRYGLRPNKPFTMPVDPLGSPRFLLEEIVLANTLPPASASNNRGAIPAMRRFLLGEESKPSGQSIPRNILDRSRPGGRPVAAIDLFKYVESGQNKSPRIYLDHTFAGKLKDDRRKIWISDEASGDSPPQSKQIRFRLRPDRPAVAEVGVSFSDRLRQFDRKGFIFPEATDPVKVELSRLTFEGEPGPRVTRVLKNAVRLHAKGNLVFWPLPKAYGNDVYFLALPTTLFKENDDVEVTVFAIGANRYWAVRNANAPVLSGSSALSERPIIFYADPKTKRFRRWQDELYARISEWLRNGAVPLGMEVETGSPVTEKGRGHGIILKPKQEAFFIPVSKAYDHGSAGEDDPQRRFFMIFRNVAEAQDGETYRRRIDVYSSNVRIDPSGYLQEHAAGVYLTPDGVIPVRTFTGPRRIIGAERYRVQAEAMRLGHWPNTQPHAIKRIEDMEIAVKQLLHVHGPLSREAIVTALSEQGEVVKDGNTLLNLLLQAGKIIERNTNHIIPVFWRDTAGLNSIKLPDSDTGRWALLPSDLQGKLNKVGLVKGENRLIGLVRRSGKVRPFRIYRDLDTGQVTSVHKNVSEGSGATDYRFENAAFRDGTARGMPELELRLQGKKIKMPGISGFVASGVVQGGRLRRIDIWQPNAHQIIQHPYRITRSKRGGITRIVVADHLPHPVFSFERLKGDGIAARDIAPLMLDRSVAGAWMRYVDALLKKTEDVFRVESDGKKSSEDWRSELLEAEKAFESRHGPTLDQIGTKRLIAERIRLSRRINEMQERNDVEALGYLLQQIKKNPHVISAQRNGFLRTVDPADVQTLEEWTAAFKSGSHDAWSRLRKLYMPVADALAREFSLNGDLSNLVVEGIRGLHWAAHSWEPDNGPIHWFFRNEMLLIVQAAARGFGRGADRAEKALQDYYAFLIDHEYDYTKGEAETYFPTGDTHLALVLRHLTARADSTALVVSVDQVFGFLTRLDHIYAVDFNPDVLRVAVPFLMHEILRARTRTEFLARMMGLHIEIDTRGEPDRPKDVLALMAEIKGRGQPINLETEVIQPSYRALKNAYGMDTWPVEEKKFQRTVQQILNGFVLGGAPDELGRVREDMSKRLNHFAAHTWLKDEAAFQTLKKRIRENRIHPIGGSVSGGGMEAYLRELAAKGRQADMIYISDGYGWMVPGAGLVNFAEKIRKGAGDGRIRPDTLGVWAYERIAPDAQFVRTVEDFLSERPDEVLDMIEIEAASGFGLEGAYHPGRGGLEKIGNGVIRPIDLRYDGAIDQVIRLAAALHNEFPAFFKDFDRSDITSILEDDVKRLSHVYAHDGKIRGFSMVGDYPEDFVHLAGTEAETRMYFPYLYYLGVDVDFRGMGIARKLLHAVSERAMKRTRFGRYLDWTQHVLSPGLLLRLPLRSQRLAEMLGIPGMFLFAHVKSDNARAVAFYERLGFEQVGEQVIDTDTRYLFYGVHIAKLERASADRAENTVGFGAHGAIGAESAPGHKETQAPEPKDKYKKYELLGAIDKVLPDGLTRREEVISYIASRFGDDWYEALSYMGNELLDPRRRDFIDRALAVRTPMPAIGEWLHHKYKYDATELRIEDFPEAFQDLVLAKTRSGHGLQPWNLPYLWVAYPYRIGNKRDPYAEALRKLRVAFSKEAESRYAVKEIRRINRLRKRSGKELTLHERARIVQHTSDRWRVMHKDKEYDRRVAELHSRNLRPIKMDGLQLTTVLQPQQLKFRHAPPGRHSFNREYAFTVWLADEKLIEALIAHLSADKIFRHRDGSLFLGKVAYEKHMSQRSARYRYQEDVVKISYLQSWLHASDRMNGDLKSVFQSIEQALLESFQFYAAGKGFKYIWAPSASMRFGNRPDQIHRNTLVRLNKLYGNAGFRLISFDREGWYWEFDLKKGKSGFGTSGEAVNEAASFFNYSETVTTAGFGRDAGTERVRSEDAAAALPPSAVTSLSWVSKFWTWFYGRYMRKYVTVEGFDRLPPSGSPFLVAGNHMGRGGLDGAAISGEFLIRRGHPVVFVTGKRSVRRPLLRSVLRHGMVLPVSAGWLTSGNMLKLLRRPGGDGPVIGIFPGGKREANYLRAWSSGVASVAREASVPIVPMAVWGTPTRDWKWRIRDGLSLVFRLITKGEPIPPFRMHVAFGDPIYAHGRSLDQIMRELRGRVEDILDGKRIDGDLFQREPKTSAQTSNSSPDVEARGAGFGDGTSREGLALSGFSAAVRVPADVRQGTTIVVSKDHEKVGFGIAGMPSDLRENVFGPANGIHLMLVGSDHGKLRRLAERIAGKTGIPIRNFRFLGSPEALKKSAYLDLLTLRLFLFMSDADKIYLPDQAYQTDGNQEFAAYLMWRVEAMRELSMAA